MLEKIKKSFRSASSKNGSYSVGMIALVICMVIVVNLIAGQLPESVKSIDIVITTFTEYQRPVKRY